MAKAGKSTLNYNAEIKQLKTNGPDRLYLLYGPEDYLRERFLDELRGLCVPDGNAFSIRRLNGPALDIGTLTEAVNAMPFLSERSFVEIRDYDFQQCKEETWEQFKFVLTDIPEWCTLVFVQPADKAPDGRLAAVKWIKKTGHALAFTEQSPATLTRWVQARFKALHRVIRPEDAQYLIFLCGTQMNALIPEIEKIAAFAEETTVTRTHIEATATRSPESNVFAVTDFIGQRKFDDAARVIGDLLGDKENHPIKLNAILGTQLRRMYAVKLGQRAGCSRKELKELSGVTYDSYLDETLSAVEPYSVTQLGKLVCLCAEYDFKMKSTGLDATVLFRELFARIAAGV